MQTFKAKDIDLIKVIHEWKENEGKLKQDNSGTYPITQIPYPYCYAAGMLCRIFSKPDSIIFSRDWVPLIDAIINSSILNWTEILSNYLAKHITEYRNKRSVSLREIPPVTPFFGHLTYYH